MSTINSKPLYAQVRDALVQKITSGEWKAGDTIPNEMDLAQSFGLSPGTVRKALTWMESARLISRQQGRGTFVLDQDSPEVFARYMRARSDDGSPLKLSLEVLGAEIAEADANECFALSLIAGAIVCRVQRRYSYQGVPRAFDICSMPAQLFPIPLDDLQGGLTLQAIARKCGVLLGAGEERLRIATADANIAARIDCAPEDCVFSYERIVNTHNGQPAEWRRGFFQLPAGVYYSVPLGAAYED